MKKELKKLKDCQVQATVSLESSELSSYRELALAEIGKVVNLKGFRKGHVPAKVVEENGGEDHILSETVNQAINKTFVKVIEEEKLEIISKPEISVASTSPLSYTATFEVKPEIKFGDYKKTKLKVKKIEVAKKEIDEQVEFFRGQIALKEEKKGAIKNGDFASVDFEGFDLKGNPLPNTKFQDFQLEVGSKKMIPGFEEEFIGLKTGDEKEFEIIFPKEYHASEMAGKKVKFKVKVNKVEEKVLPELNEELVQKITGTKKSVEDFRSEIEAHLKDKKRVEETRRLEDELLNAWSDQISFEIPLSEKAAEVDQMLDNVKMQGLQNGMPWEYFLQAMGKTEEEVKKSFEENATANVKKRYIVQEVIKSEGFQVSDKDIEVQLSKYEIEALARGQKFDKKKYKKGSKGYLTIANQLLVQKVFDTFLPKVEI